MGGVRVMHLGRMSYLKALSVQQQLVLKYKQYKDMGTLGEVGTLITVEHPPVYTLGRRERMELYDTRDLKAEVVKVKRGGLITFHGPDVRTRQSSVIRTLQIGVRDYVHSLEKAVIKVCTHYGVKSCTTENVGVWINDDKICAIGIQVSHGVTWHGLGLNCNVDLSWFQHILPCGLEEKGVTSLSHAAGINVSPDDVRDVLIKNLMEELRLREI